MNEFDAQKDLLTQAVSTDENHMLYQKNDMLTPNKYYIYEVPETKEKQVVISLDAKEDIRIKQLGLEITELDNQHVRYKKSIYELSDISILNRGDFILPMRFELDNACHKIAIKILHVYTTDKPNETEDNQVNLEVGHDAKIISYKNHEFKVPTIGSIILIIIFILILISTFLLERL